MEIRFIGDKVNLDLSRTKLTIQESNSMVNDKMFTKFTFPYTQEVDEEVIYQLGDIISYEAQIENEIKGFFYIENKTSEAVNYITDIEGTEVTGQIDYGLDDVPNFNKKLSELPLENFKVDDIYKFAKEICGKKYPEVNYNFPRIYTKKYDPSSKMWDAFSGYYNDLKDDGSEMRRNYIDETNQEIYNVNIIHPMPHFIYLLKAGFRDAGYELKGDILTDEDLQNEYVFSGGQYFSTLSQTKYAESLGLVEYESLFSVNVSLWKFKFGRYKKVVPITKPGNYKIFGTFYFNKLGLDLPHFAKIFVGGNEIWSKFIKSKHVVDGVVSFSIDVYIPITPSNIDFYIETRYDDGDFNQVLQCSVISKELEANDVPKEESGVVTNLNEVDLRRAVPEITFGDLVNFARNCLNYDLTPIGKTIVMNKIQVADINNVEDFEFAEIKKPKRNTLPRRSFLLKYVDLDNSAKLDQMFFDKDGPKLNGTPNDSTITIEANGYPMPVELAKPNGYKTGIVKKDSSDCVQLVHYEGLQNGQNNATANPNLFYPTLFEKRWRRWLRQRIYGMEFVWRFLVNPAFFAKYSIKNYIFCYNQNHIIKSWTKEYIPGKTEDEDVYEVEITTETIN